MKPTVLLAIALIPAAAGCGGEPSPEDQVRAAARAGTEALISDHPERSCNYVMDRQKCVGTVVLARGMDMAAVTGLPDDWEKRIERADVKVSGTAATISDFNGDGKPGRYVLKDGKWLADNR